MPGNGEPVSRTSRIGKGRPAELFRFRRKVLTDEIALEILTELGFCEEEEPPPDCVESVAVPGLEEIRSKMSDCRSQIQESKSDLEEHTGDPGC